jgi:hypothetical protein
MTGNVTYTRIANTNTTTLASNLNIADTVMVVSDINALPEPNPELAIPGVVFVNGEKITYYQRFTANSSVGQLRRAVDGTGGAALHLAGSRVVDSSLQQLIQGNVHTSTWLNMTGNVADGTGFNGSITNELTFLRESPSYNP